MKKPSLINKILNIIRSFLNNDHVVSEAVSNNQKATINNNRSIDQSFQFEIQELIDEWKEQAIVDENGWSYRHCHNHYNEGAAYAYRQCAHQLESLLAYLPSEVPCNTNSQIESYWKNLYANLLREHDAWASIANDALNQLKNPDTSTPFTFEQDALEDAVSIANDDEYWRQTAHRFSLDAPNLHTGKLIGNKWLQGKIIKLSDTTMQVQFLQVEDQHVARFIKKDSVHELQFIRHSDSCVYWKIVPDFISDQDPENDLVVWMVWEAGIGWTWEY